MDSIAETLVHRSKLPRMKVHLDQHPPKHPTKSDEQQEAFTELKQHYMRNTIKIYSPKNNNKSIQPN